MSSPRGLDLHRLAETEEQLYSKALDQGSVDVQFSDSAIVGVAVQSSDSVIVGVDVPHALRLALLTASSYRGYSCTPHHHYDTKRLHSSVGQRQL